MRSHTSRAMQWGWWRVSGHQAKLTFNRASPVETAGHQRLNRLTDKHSFHMSSTLATNRSRETEGGQGKANKTRNTLVLMRRAEFNMTKHLYLRRRRRKRKRTPLHARAWYSTRVRLRCSLGNKLHIFRESCINNLTSKSNYSLHISPRAQLIRPQSLHALSNNILKRLCLQQFAGNFFFSLSLFL